MFDTLHQSGSKTLLATTRLHPTTVRRSFLGTLCSGRGRTHRLHHTETIGESHNLAADEALETLTSASGRKRGGDDVLLGKHALDDTGRATDRLKIARVGRDDEDLGLHGEAIGIRYTDVELECKVSYAET
jgi:hypothetical protein